MSKMGSRLKPHKNQKSIWLWYTFQRYKCPNCGDIRVVTEDKFDKPDHWKDSPDKHEMGGVPR